MANQSSLTSHEEITQQYYVQDYSFAKQGIDGVKQLPLKTWMTEDGDFSELIRLNEVGELEAVPGFKVRQINRSTLLPNTIKAWHFHLKQSEVWYVPPTGQLLLGLWDVRKNSPTSGATMRIVLGGAAPSAVYIPQGVAHGAANMTGNAASLYYFVSQQFDAQQPDENRIPWNSLPDFWMPQRD